MALGSDAPSRHGSLHTGQAMDGLLPGADGMASDFHNLFLAVRQPAYYINRKDMEDIIQNHRDMTIKDRPRCPKRTVPARPAAMTICTNRPIPWYN